MRATKKLYQPSRPRKGNGLGEFLVDGLNALDSAKKEELELTTTKALVTANERLAKSVLINLRHLNAKIKGELIPGEREAEAAEGLNNSLLYTREMLLESIKLISDVAGYLGTEEA
jgi:hypothetical protein